MCTVCVKTELTRGDGLTCEQHENQRAGARATLESTEAVGPRSVTERTCFPPFLFSKLICSWCCSEIVTLNGSFEVQGGFRYV